MIQDIKKGVGLKVFVTFHLNKADLNRMLYIH